MNAWFRFYHEVLDDPKVQRLSPKTFKIWINVLCLAARYGGVLPNSTDVSFALRVSLDKAIALLTLLHSKGLLDCKEGVYSPHRWSDRQFKSDGSTERVKRFRERSSNVSETANATGPEQNRTDTPIVPKGTTYTPAFEEFWKSYPRATGKGAAFKAWKAAKPNPDILTAMLVAIDIQKKSEQWTRSNGQFIPNPATWINQRRWEDEQRKPEARVRSVHDYL